MSIKGRSIKAAAFVALTLSGCRAHPVQQPQFPTANRDVAPIVSDTFSTEDARDRLGEFDQVVRLSGIKPGMSLADVGAGEGYYTVRLARAVGTEGRVLAEDIDTATRDSLTDRVQRERIDNVAVKLGTPDNPTLPPQSFDRIFLVHMYHEVQSPYEFLWHLREGVKPDGRVVVVDSNRPVKHHGIPPEQLKCEFAALGMAPISFQMLPGSDVFFMDFRVSGPRPAPAAIKPCGAQR